MGNALTVEGVKVVYIELQVGEWFRKVTALTVTERV